MPLTKEDPEYHWVACCLIGFQAPRLPGGLASIPVAQRARTVGISLGPPEMLWQLPSSPAPQHISSSNSPVAVVYQLQQLCSCSVSALLPSEKPSEHLESCRTQVYFAGNLQGDRSPESDPPKKGFTRLLWATSSRSMLGWSGQSEIRQGSRCRNKFTETGVCGGGGGVVRGSWLDFPWSSWPGSLLSTFLSGHFLLQEKWKFFINRPLFFLAKPIRPLVISSQGRTEF